MSRTTAFGTLIIGGAMVASSYYFYNQKFSNESIWKRQIGVIERVSFGNPDQKKKNFDELRKSLNQIPRSNYKRCRFEIDYQLKMEPHTKDEILNKNFDTYSKCTVFEISKDFFSSWQGWIGLVGLVPLFVGLSSIPDLFRKKLKF